MVIDFIPRVVAGFPDRAVGAEIELALLVEIERPGADAAEDGDLVARFVHGPVAVDALGDRQRVGRPAGSGSVAISCGVGRGLKPSLPGVSGEVSCTTRMPFLPSAR